MGLSFMTAFFCVKETTLENISGYVENIIYRNAANGYSVLNLVSEEEVIVVGFFSAIDEGDTIEVKGTYTEHAVYGVQFKAESYEIKMLTDIAGIRRYLSSGAIKGIGPSLAERIIKKFAEDTFRIMEEEPERLAEVKGISERKAMEIGQQAGSKKELKDAIMDNSPKILLELDREFAFVSKEYPFLSEMLKNLLICCSTTYKNTVML